MYGVIVCPHCTLVQGADLSKARITCPRCRSKIPVRRAKVYFSTDSPKELAEGVRQVGERLVYDIETPGAVRVPVPERKPSGTDHGPSSDGPAGSRPEGERHRWEDLAHELGDVDDEELDRVIALMLQAGILVRGFARTVPGSMSSAIQAVHLALADILARLGVGELGIDLAEHRRGPAPVGLPGRSRLEGLVVIGQVVADPVIGEVDDPVGPEDQEVLVDHIDGHVLPSPRSQRYIRL
jgi:hypothetical protein